jgi:hypothetical protein
VRKKNRTDGTLCSAGEEDGIGKDNVPRGEHWKNQCPLDGIEKNVPWKGIFGAEISRIRHDTNQT